MRTRLSSLSRSQRANSACRRAPSRRGRGGARSTPTARRRGRREQRNQRRHRHLCNSTMYMFQPRSTSSSSTRADPSRHRREQQGSQTSTHGHSQGTHSDRQTEQHNSDFHQRTLSMHQCARQSMSQQHSSSRDSHPARANRDNHRAFIMLYQGIHNNRRSRNNHNNNQSKAEMHPVFRKQAQEESLISSHGHSQSTQSVLQIEQHNLDFQQRQHPHSNNLRFNQQNQQSHNANHANRNNNNNQRRCNNRHHQNAHSSHNQAQQSNTCSHQNRKSYLNKLQIF